MTAFIAALTAVAVLGGLMLVIVGLIPQPVVARPPSRANRFGSRLVDATGGQTRKARTRRLVFLAGVAAGMVGWLFTGWLVLVIILPAAFIGIPILLAAPQNATSVLKLEAMAEWTRSLAGVLTVGVGIEQAITASLRSTPDAIKPEVTVLVARIRARWNTLAALRAFADDLDDATGDLIASTLILGASRRGSGLASVLEGLATTVADDVQARRKIEADRAKPRTTARLVTFITLGMIAFMSFNTNYIEPYGSAIGQIVLTSLLAGYVACLLWMKQITKSTPLPRFMGTRLRAAYEPTRAPVTSR